MTAMIELRWDIISSYGLGDSKPPVSSIPIQEQYTTNYMVLQFRQEEGPKGENWWGDWQDVPIAEGKEG